jgi:hypothetical protein
MQDVSKIKGITSGMNSSYVDNKNSLYQHTRTSIGCLEWGPLSLMRTIEELLE